MTSKRSYILRALLEWIADNNQTPYVDVNAEVPGVIVPQNYVQNGRIVLNISNTAVRDLRIDNQHLEFGGRFGGNPIRVVVPVGAIVALYAKETGDGMVFDTEYLPVEKAQPTALSAPATKPRNHLSVVK